MEPILSGEQRVKSRVLVWQHQIQNGRIVVILEPFSTRITSVMACKPTQFC